MKTQLIIPLSMLLCMAISSGCKKDEVEPVACFKCSFAVTSPFSKNFVDEPVSFTNCTSDGDHYEWDFGNGKTSTEASPSITYTSDGTYSVRLTAYSKSGKKNHQTSQEILIEKRRTGSFSATFNGGNCNFTGSLSYSQSDPMPPFDATYPAPGLQITANYSGGPNVGFRLTNFTGTTGTFKLGGTVTSNWGTLYGCNNDPFTSKNWSTGQNDSGTVVITQVDLIKKQVSGAFSFNASGQIGVISVTNGSFSQINY